MTAITDWWDLKRLGPPPRSQIFVQSTTAISIQHVGSRESHKKFRPLRGILVPLSPRTLPLPSAMAMARSSVADAEPVKLDDPQQLESRGGTLIHEHVPKSAGYEEHILQHNNLPLVFFSLMLTTFLVCTNSSPKPVNLVK